MTYTLDKRFVVAATVEGLRVVSFQRERKKSSIHLSV